MRRTALRFAKHPFGEPGFRDRFMRHEEGPPTCGPEDILPAWADYERGDMVFYWPLMKRISAI
jgi:hypothetical protein